MEIDSNRLAIIIISVLMITSVVGFAFWMSPATSDQPASPQDSAQQPAPVILNFEAEEVPVTVTNILPVLRLTAFTDEANILNIERELISLDGVLSLEISRFETSVESRQLVYVAEVVLENEEIDQIQMVETIEQQTSLQDVFAVKKALLRLPSTVRLHNADLDLEKVLTFRQPFSEGLISLDSLMGDALKVHLIVSLQGEELVGVPYSYETENVSDATLQFSDEATVEVVSLTPSLVFAGKFDYNGFSFSDLNQQILSGVSDNNFVYFDRDTFVPDLNVLIDLETLEGLGFDPDTFREDLVDFTSALEGVFTTRSTEDSDEGVIRLAVVLSTTHQYPEFVSEMTEFLSDQGFVKNETFAFQTKQMYMEGEVTIESLDSLQESAEELANVLLANGVILRIDNVAMVSLKEPLTVNSEEEMAVPQFEYSEEFPALILPEHAMVGEEVELTVTFFVKRGEVIYAQGSEKIDLQEQLRRMFLGN